jgi:hypothetical protein
VSLVLGASDIKDVYTPPSGGVPYQPNIPAFTFIIEGFGKQTYGAHSYPPFYDGVKEYAELYTVTNLSSDQDVPGSLFYGLREHGRYIVFDGLEGEIDMTNANVPSGGDPQDSDTWRINFVQGITPNLQSINRNYITIDGRTAGSAGIKLTNQHRLGIQYLGPPQGSPTGDWDRHDIIISNIAMDSNAGPYSNGNPNNHIGELLVMDGTSFFSGGNHDTIYNIVLDHLTCINGLQGAANVYGWCRDITIQHLWHKDSMLGHHISDAGRDRERISIYKSCYSNTNERHPRVRNDTLKLDCVGNFIYGWAWAEGLDGAMEVVDFTSRSSMNHEYNNYHWPTAVGEPTYAETPPGNQDARYPWYNSAVNTANVAGGLWMDNNIYAETAIDFDGDNRTAGGRQSMIHRGTDYALPRSHMTRAELLDVGAQKSAAETTNLTAMADDAGL